MGGFVTEVTIAGAGLLRIDIPSATGDITQYYPPSAMFCLTPTTEAMARAVAANFAQQPVHRWELPAAPAAAAEPDDDEEEDATRDAFELDEVP